ncbi:MAG: TIGR04086 family membrane protein [Clostridiales bacterium]|nr:TIGR04086 family membrane protein [Clostridiales bacterium]
MSKHDNASKNSTKYILIRAAIRASVCSVIYFVLTAVFVAVSLKLDLPRENDLIFVLISAAVTAAIAGYASVRPVRKNGLALGAFACLPCFLIIMLVSAFTASKLPGVKALIFAAVMLLFGSLGGILAANQKRK